MSSILVIDDDPDNFDVIDTFLGQQGYHLHYASNGRTAIDDLDKFKPDLILLDVMMPEMTGIEVCQWIKAMPEWQAVPIIMVTALATKKNLAECFAAGADDFICKPLDRLELIARVRSMLRIHRQYEQIATFNLQLEAMVEQRTAQLHTMVFQDALTNLPSRTFLLDKLTDLFYSGHQSLALIYLDCDQFKMVNGSFGYAVGDQLIIAIAQRLEQYLSPGDVLARMGEDEFCFLVNHIDSPTQLESLIHNILQGFQANFTVADCEIFMTVCAGATYTRDRHQQPEELLQEADTAMYQAKLRGKGSYQLFQHQMHLEILNRLILENDLQRALKHEEFILYYQPIIHLGTQTLVGFEALLRWQHPERNLVPPGEFIPCMETTGLIVPVGLMSLTQACQQLSTWQQQGWMDLTLSVNLSTRQFACPSLLADIDHILAETAINPAQLKLEITESAIMDNAEMAIDLAKELRSRQIQISIDDFGTGYSSLAYLHRLPVDSLKIDRSFVSQIQTDNRNYQIVKTIIGLGRQLNLAVIAEGIETSQQLEWLKELDCEFGQGYLFSRPIPATEIEQLYLTRS
mgnify:CR=1 FL=1